MNKVKFTKMKDGSKEEYLLLDKFEQKYINDTADRILKFMSGLNSTLEGYKITRLEHSLQTATRAMNDKASEEMIVAALLHDIGHGPFSHLFEEVMKEKSKITHEEIGREIILKTSILNA